MLYELDLSNPNSQVMIPTNTTSLDLSNNELGKKTFEELARVFEAPPP